MSQQRKKIFLDCSLPHRKWFDKLPLKFQMAWLLINMLCDNVGVYELNVRALKFHLKEEFNPDEFLNAINESKRRIEVLPNGSWWIKSYLPLQVKTLTPNNPPHVSYFEDLQSHGLLKKYVKENSDSVNIEVIFEMETSDKDNHKKMLHVLKSKTLLRPLQEAWYNSKEKEEEKEKDQEQDEDKDEEQSLTHSYIDGNNSEDFFS